MGASQVWKGTKSENFVSLALILWARRGSRVYGHLGQIDHPLPGIGLTVAQALLLLKTGNPICLSLMQ